MSQLPELNCKFRKVNRWSIFWNNFNDKLQHIISIATVQKLQTLLHSLEFILELSRLPQFLAFLGVPNPWITQPLDYPTLGLPNPWITQPFDYPTLETDSAIRWRKRTSVTSPKEQRKRVVRTFLKLSLKCLLFFVNSGVIIENYYVNKPIRFFS